MAPSWWSTGLRPPDPRSSTPRRSTPITSHSRRPSDPKEGRGLRCARGRCVKLCEEDDGCKDYQRCAGRGYTGLVAFGKPQYLFCINATLAPGSFCGSARNRKLPPDVCRRGSACISNLCRKLCRHNRDCPKRKRCKGTAYKPGRYIGKPDYRFCK